MTLEQQESHSGGSTGFRDRTHSVELPVRLPPVVVDS